jgi:hypothetical protein
MVDEEEENEEDEEDEKLEESRKKIGEFKGQPVYDDVEYHTKKWREARDAYAAYVKLMNGQSNDKRGEKLLKDLEYHQEAKAKAKAYKLEESKSSIEHDIEYYKELVSDDKKRLKNASGGEAEMILQNLAHNQKMLSRAKRQLKLEESEKGVDLRDDKSCKCKGCGNPVKEGMLLCEKCEERGFYIAPNGKVVSPEEDVKEHLELTTAEIKKMVDDSKDMTPEEQRKIALSLPMTACALYVLEMKKRHNKKVSI